jgi:hypothetical protein
MNDQELARLSGQGRSFDEVKRLLRLDDAQGRIVEGSSLDLLTYRFPVENRTLFLEVNRSNIVTRAYFGDHSTPVIEETTTNGVIKPKGG